MSESFDFGGDIVWQPSAERVENANLTRFMRDHGIEDFETLMRRSTEDVPWFTEAVLEFLDIRFSEPYERVVDLSKGIMWPEWCVGGRMNIVHNCLDKHAGTAVDSTAALVWEGEEGTQLTLTYAELRSEVNKAANGLRSLGLGKGDAIGLYMPMTPEIIVALLAIAKIGGVILPLFSGYGVDAVVNRLADAEAKALFTSDGAFRRGNVIPMKTTADESAAQIPSLQHMIVHRRTGADVVMIEGRDHWWHDLIESQSTEATTEGTAAEDTLMIIYTSGTTGRPKGAVHTHCGFPIKSAQDMAFGTDVHEGELVYWMTDMGWMMGPWLVFGALLNRAALFAFDGAPDFPGPGRVWDMVERHGINVFGLSPTFVRALIPHGNETFTGRDLSSLHSFASTGEPWNPGPWMWLFEEVGKSELPIINYSGGTEISGGIVMGNPVLPLKACAFSGPCPGIAADILDENGESVQDAVGELAIRAPWIGMTRGFWQDPERYEETYWQRWPGIWLHGDFAAVDDDGLWYILGRSDDTIKVAGKRLGPAEVESVLVAHSAVVEAVAIGVPHEVKGSALVVFCVLNPGWTQETPSPSDSDSSALETLRGELRAAIVAAMGKALAPQAVFYVDDLPKTRNAKVMRRMVRNAYLGLDLGDTSSLVNPEAVAAIGRAT